MSFKRPCDLNNTSVKKQTKKKTLNLTCGNHDIINKEEFVLRFDAAQSAATFTNDNQMPPPPKKTPQPQLQCSITDSVERIKKELKLLQGHSQSMKLESEKLATEKLEIRRQYDMMSQRLNFEVQKQTEIAKRLNAIIGQILPFLSLEHQQQVSVAVERAKSITMNELNSICGRTCEIENDEDLVVDNPSPVHNNTASPRENVINKIDVSALSNSSGAPTTNVQRKNKNMPPFNSSLSITSSNARKPSAKKMEDREKAPTPISKPLTPTSATTVNPICSCVSKVGPSGFEAPGLPPSSVAAAYGAHYPPGPPLHLGPGGQHPHLDLMAFNGYAQPRAPVGMQHYDPRAMRVSAPPVPFFAMQHGGNVHPPYCEVQHLIGAQVHCNWLGRQEGHALGGSKNTNTD